MEHFGWRAAIAVSLIALAAVAWYAVKALILIFAAALPAVFLDLFAGKLAETVQIRRGRASAIVAAGISQLLCFAAWNALPRVADQVSQPIRGLRGFKGLALATPVTGARLVLVRMLYPDERPRRHSRRALPAK